MTGNAASGGRAFGTRWRLAAWGTAAELLLLPLLAMQVSDEVAWGRLDFVFAAALVLAVGLTFELAARRTRSRAYRAGVGVALAAAFLLVWINAAVGIIGSEENPANRMYLGVLAVGIVGAILARFRPKGMARALVAAALAQAAVAAVALAFGLGFTVPIDGFFVALWLASAWLFRKAAREQTPAGAT